VRFLDSKLPTPLLILATGEFFILVANTLLLQTWLAPAAYGPVRIATPLLVSLFCFLSMFGMGVYESRRREGYVGMMLRTAVALFLIALIALTLLASLSAQLAAMQAVFVYSIGSSFLLLAGWRALFPLLVPETRFRKRILVFGSGDRALRIASRTRRESDQKRFLLIGFARDSAASDGDSVSRVGAATFDLGGTSLLALCHSLSVDELVVALDDSTMDTPDLRHSVIAQLSECRMSGIVVIEASEFIEREQRRLDIDLLSARQVALGPSFSMDARRVLIKRVFDIFAGVALLLMLWPLMLATALAIFLESKGGGSILLRQERVGLRGRTFVQLKFRSMVENAEPDGPTWTRPNDSRITRVGAFIRSTRLDEFPQLFNVLRGEMSFVGPRPERPIFVRQFEAEIPFYAARHLVKPGITGWAQLRYPYGASAKDAKEKLQYDLYYLKRQSVLFDLVIMLQTVEVILVGEGAR
jgi:sugar transferase (PEP-CTERM system associated)